MKTVIEMAREAGLERNGYWEFDLNRLERFATLVRADERNKWQDQTAVEIHEAILDEREACAKVCDEADKDSDWPTAANCAAAIRARGNT